MTKKELEELAEEQKEHIKRLAEKMKALQKGFFKEMGKSIYDAIKDYSDTEKTKDVNDDLIDLCWDLLRKIKAYKETTNKERVEDLVCYYDRVSELLTNGCKNYNEIMFKLRGHNRGYLLSSQEKYQDINP